MLITYYQNLIKTPLRRYCAYFGCLLFTGLVFSIEAQAEDQSLRVVSVGGALTEIVYRLGAEEQLVGVDTTSLFPETATKLPQVGYQRALSAEGLLSLNPTVVLVTDQAGPPAVIEQIKATGVKLVVIPTHYSAEGVANKIEKVAEALNRQVQGEALAREFRAEMAALQAKITASSQEGTTETTDNEQAKPRVAFLLSVGKGSPMAAGKNTAANAMIELAGAANALISHEGYKPVSTEAMIAANPDILLLSDRTIEGLGGVDGVLKLPGIQLTTAGKQQRVLAMEGLSLLGFTPRLPAAVAELNKLMFSAKQPGGSAAGDSPVQQASQQTE